MVAHPQPKSFGGPQARGSEFACKESSVEKGAGGGRERELQISRLKLRAPGPAHLLQTGSHRFSSTQKFVSFAKDFQERLTFDSGGGGEEPGRAQTPDLKRISWGSGSRVTVPKVRAKRRSTEHPRAPWLPSPGTAPGHSVLT